jgi:hypothetical protein
MHIDPDKLTLEKWVNVWVMLTGKAFAETGEVSPTCAVEKGDGSIALLYLDFSDNAAKNEMVSRIKKFLIEHDAKRYVVISESWAADFHKDMPNLKELIKRVEKLGVLRSGVPKKEIICYTAEDREGALWADQEIVREEGKEPTLTPVKFHPRNEVNTGRLVGLMPRKGKTTNEHHA